MISAKDHQLRKKYTIQLGKDHQLVLKIATEDVRKPVSSSRVESSRAMLHVDGELVVGLRQKEEDEVGFYLVYP
ncbi:hypothetical protein F2Q70_00008311 [Brassica cretica]|uniref:Uncharacterized protein n=1 Tax=Brassica cretica TaxID=69181 RepID=A0A8S9LZM1_BRACR|nr:hypothetical protein F2Q70_00008311 [Brassica cretica]